MAAQPRCLRRPSACGEGCAQSRSWPAGHPRRVTAAARRSRSTSNARDPRCCCTRPARAGCRRCPFQGTPSTGGCQGTRRVRPRPCQQCAVRRRDALDDQCPPSQRTATEDQARLLQGARGESPPCYMRSAPEVGRAPEYPAAAAESIRAGNKPDGFSPTVRRSQPSAASPTPPTPRSRHRQLGSASHTVHATSYSGAWSTPAAGLVFHFKVTGNATAATSGNGQFNTTTYS